MTNVSLIRNINGCNLKMRLFTHTHTLVQWFCLHLDNLQKQHLNQLIIHNSATCSIVFVKRIPLIAFYLTNHLTSDIPNYISAQFWLAWTLPNWLVSNKPKWVSKGYMEGKKNVLIEAALFTISSFLLHYVVIVIIIRCKTTFSESHRNCHV